MLADRVGRAHSPPRDPVEQHAGGGARRDPQATGQAGRWVAGQQRAHSLHGSWRGRWAVDGGRRQAVGGGVGAGAGGGAEGRGRDAERRRAPPPAVTFAAL